MTWAVLQYLGTCNLKLSFEEIWSRSCLCYVFDWAKFKRICYCTYHLSKLASKFSHQQQCTVGSSTVCHPVWGNCFFMVPNFSIYGTRSNIGSSIVLCHLCIEQLFLLFLLAPNFFIYGNSSNVGSSMSSCIKQFGLATVADADRSTYVGPQQLVWKIVPTVLSEHLAKLLLLLQWRTAKEWRESKARPSETELRSCSV